jgi:hypothetical protein
MYEHWDLTLQVGTVWNLLDSDARMTALARASSSYKRQIYPLFKEGAPHQHTHNYVTVIKICLGAPDGSLTSRQTDRLTE